MIRIVSRSTPVVPIIVSVVTRIGSSTTASVIFVIFRMVGISTRVGKAVIHSNITLRVRVVLGVILIVGWLPVVLVVLPNIRSLETTCASAAEKTTVVVWKSSGVKSTVILILVNASASVFGRLLVFVEGWCSFLFKIKTIHLRKDKNQHSSRLNQRSRA